MDKTIYTFWESEKDIPAYLKLCLESWHKFLPDYKIVVLDYKKLDDFLGVDYFNKILFKDFSYPKQADAVRAAILARHGGIWMDLDTIITSNEINKIFEIESDFVTIGRHIAFIKAVKGSKIACEWDKKVRKYIEFYEKVKYSNTGFQTKIASIMHPKIYRNLENWDYLGNFILKKMLKTKNKKKFYSLDRFKINALPELNFNPCVDDLSNNYQQYYFNNDFSADILKTTKGIILLHNSWTPQNVLKMTKEEFLQMNCTLSNLLGEVLK